MEMKIITLLLCFFVVFFPSYSVLFFMFCIFILHRLGKQLLTTLDVVGQFQSVSCFFSGHIETNLCLVYDIDLIGAKDCSYFTLYIPDGEVL